MIFLSRVVVPLLNLLFFQVSLFVKEARESFLDETKLNDDLQLKPSH